MLECTCIDAVLRSCRAHPTELQPCRNGSDGEFSGDEAAANARVDDGSLSARAHSWLSAAMSPISALQERRAEDQARQQRIAVLKAGAEMKLLGAREATRVRVALSSDGAMITWQSVRGEGGASSESGVIALAMIREIRPVMSGGLGALLGARPVPLQWMLVADEETVKFETETETQKETWMASLEELSKRQADAKVDRKIGYMAKRRLGLEERRREAERRKAAVLQSCGAVGMKHTAQAMMSRT
uniref:PH domain-containing protein n=1 Tax=Calcidiscus leptoporus TaxID=127549 RepID=A0A7S0P0E2_9EUKA|mmetsp:Transcript_45674/g.106540  ORF Transcript_45674/g.106540 Transcript_45674/m.106540 type:complete len:245 (+) Transcript_45674:11-745(+)